VRSCRRRGGRRRRCSGSWRARWQPYGTCPPTRFREASYPARAVEISTSGSTPSGSGQRAGGGEVCLEAQDRLRVELGDAGLGDAEHLPNLAERQLLVVVERHHELLALGQESDRLGERLLLLGDGE